MFVSGNYAYIADGSDGLIVLDVSNPGSPKLVGSYDTDGTAYGVYVNGNYAYVTTQHVNNQEVGGLVVFDISDPTNPTLIGRNDKGWYEICVRGGYAYVADGFDGLDVIDVNDPSNPVLVGNYDTGNYAVGVYVTGNYAYVADQSDGLDILDVSNPSHPEFMGNYDTGDYAVGVYVTGKYAYVAAENSGFDILDMSDPKNPKLLGNLHTNGSPRNVYVIGNYAYVTDQSDGLDVIDVSDPGRPKLVDNYDTEGNAYNLHVSNAYIYVADWSDGIVILKNDLINTGNSKGLVADYSFEGNANDSGPYNLNGQIMGTPTYANGVIGKALYFNGKDTYIKLPPSKEFEPDTSSYSVSCWVKYEQDAKVGKVFLATKYPGSYRWVQISIDPSNNSIYFGMKSGTAESETSASYQGIKDGKWHFVVGVRDSIHSIKLYVDGRLIDRKYNSKLGYVETTGNPGSEAFIGYAHTYGQLYNNGYIDELKIYRRALSANEVDSTYKADLDQSSFTSRNKDISFKYTHNLNDSFDPINNGPLNNLTVGFHISNISNDPIRGLKVSATVNGNSVDLYHIPFSNGWGKYGGQNISLPDSSGNFMIKYEGIKNNSTNHIRIHVYNDSTVDFYKEQTIITKFVNINGPFYLTKNAYKFPNTTVNYWDDLLGILKNVKLPTAAFFSLRMWINHMGEDGLCYGIAGTTGDYYLNPLEKPYTSDPSTWLYSDPVVKENIYDYFMSQKGRITLPSDTSNLKESIDSSITFLSNGEPFIMGLMGVYKDNLGHKSIGYHAVLCVKIDIYKDDNTILYYLYDSNFYDGDYKYMTINTDGSKMYYSNYISFIPIAIHNLSKTAVVAEFLNNPIKKLSQTYYTIIVSINKRIYELEV